MAFKVLEMIDESDLNTLLDKIQFRVEKVMDSYGFSRPHSATSVTHNIMANSAEKQKDETRMLALSSLVAFAKSVSKDCRQDTKNYHNLTQLDLAIVTVEKEFKQ